MTLTPLISAQLDCDSRVFHPVGAEACQQDSFTARESAARRLTGDGNNQLTARPPGNQTQRARCRFGARQDLQISVPPGRVFLPKPSHRPLALRVLALPSQPKEYGVDLHARPEAAI